MKVIKNTVTNEFFSNWRLNSKAQFVDINTMAGQMAFFDDTMVKDTIADLEAAGHTVVALDLVIG